MLNWLRASMSKPKAEAELFEGRYFDREVIILCVRLALVQIAVTRKNTCPLRSEDFKPQAPHPRPQAHLGLERPDVPSRRPPCTNLINRQG
jgi:hypothetical protein